MLTDRVIAPSGENPRRETSRVAYGVARRALSSIRTCLFDCFDSKRYRAFVDARPCRGIPDPMVSWALDATVRYRCVGQVLSRMRAEALHPQAISFDSFGVVALAKHLHRLCRVVSIAQ